MPRVKWDGSMETGDALVDGQHQSLVALFNELADADKTGDQREVVSVLDRLTDYVMVHFSAEEGLMRSHGYPEESVLAHQAEHRALTERTRAFVLSYRSGELASVEPLVAFLSDWLAHHIEESDRLFVQFARGES